MERTLIHTSQTLRPQAISLLACNPSKGPHRHVLDKDRQIRLQRLRLTTALALITGWPVMKETDDMSLFVFSFNALNHVNTTIQMMAKVCGTKKKKHTDKRQRTSLWAESSTHHTQVFAHHQSEQTPEVKRNKGATSKTFSRQPMPRKTNCLVVSSLLAKHVVVVG